MNKTVNDILRVKGRSVESISPNATILDASQRMSSRKIGCLAVSTRQNRLCGIITERDCMWKTSAAGESPRRKLVKEKMTPIAHATTVPPTHTVDDCLNLMADGGLTHLLVTEGTSLAGVLSFGDVVKFATESHQAIINSLQNYIMHGTL